MRAGKYFLMMSLLLMAGLSAGAVARADDVRVSAYLVFREPTATDPSQFTFTSTFLYDPETFQLVPGTMFIRVVDTLPGTPYTDWVPKPNFHSPNFTYFDPDLDGISLGFNSPSILLQIGSYPISDSILFCATRTCTEHFSPTTGDSGIRPIAGELTVSAVAEPGVGMLLGFAAVAGSVLFGVKVRPFRRFHT